MASRILRTLLVVSIVTLACYYVWFWAWSHLVGPEFGMPEYEEEVEMAFIIGSVVFAVVPIFISVRVCGFLNRRFPVPSGSS